MFSSVQSFISRHRYKFIFGGIAIGGIVLISDFAKRVWKEAQERETKEILERNRKFQHYEGTEEICNKTALTMAQTLSTRITDKLAVKDILNRLKSGAPNKVELWEQLMLLSFTKVIAMVYASSLVLILLRIQLNLIGGYIFRDSADGTKRLDSGSQDKYLSLYNNLFENGIYQLINLIKQKVKLVLKNKSLKDKMTVKDIEKLFWAIQTSISRDVRDPCKTMSKYCLPDVNACTPNNRSDQCNHRVNGTFDRIVEETRDILESGEIETLAQSAVVSGFTLVVDELSDYFINKCNSLKSKESDDTVASTSSYEKSDDLIDLSSVSLPMARILPMLNDLVSDTYKSNGFAETLMLRLIFMDSLKAMGANVYEAFSTNF